MTDTELKRRKAICDVAEVDDIGELSDGSHTFNGLYKQRLILFAALVKVYKDKSWKSHRHEDGELCFGGDWFIVGIDTPEGSYTYHYENKYWDMFNCVYLPRAKHWDGHTEEDVTRLLSLPDAPAANVGNTINRQAAINAICAVCGNDCDKSEFLYNAPQDEQIILCPEHYVLTQLPPAQSDFDITVKIDKAYDDGYEAGYLQGKHDWGDLDE